MKSFEYTIKDPIGFHARPAGLFAKEASKFSSEITFKCKGKAGSAKRIFSIMGLEIKCGDTVVVEIKGEDEAAAFEAVKKFFETNL